MATTGYPTKRGKYQDILLLEFFITSPRENDDETKNK